MVGSPISVRRPDPLRALKPDLPALTALRGAAVALGPSLLVDLLAVAGTLALATGRLHAKQQRLGHLPRALLTSGAAFPWAYFLLLRPWLRRWGATDEELRMPLPGDELVPNPGYQHTRAVTIRAPAEEVWPWLAQIGQGRGGFYSYEWLENLAGCEIRNADRIQPQWQDVKPGDPVAIMRGWGTKLAGVEPGRSLVIEGWGTYAVRPIKTHISRLIARARQPKGISTLAYLLTVEIPHFVMERKMLLSIKERAELATGGPWLIDRILPAARYRGYASVRIRASRATIFRALREVTLAEMPLAYALGTIRYLPGLLTGQLRRRSDKLTRPFMDLVARPPLAEAPERELVVGTIGKLHDLLDQQVVRLQGPDAFARFNRPDYEKHAESFRIAGGSDEEGYTLLAEHRTETLGPSARWKFALYWYLLVGWSGNLLLRMLLEAVKRRAERAETSQVSSLAPSSGEVQGPGGNRERTQKGV
jgi:hypothetical protein